VGCLFLVKTGRDHLGGVNKLDPPPLQIKDRFSAILGNGFHARHRIIVPVHHTSKKPFFVALSEAEGLSRYGRV
jgi:hypothetical protein